MSGGDCVITQSSESRYDVGMELNDLCERGQAQLQRMEYLQAEKTLVEAERLATAAGDFDTLSRLYMPLQESRRQRRQTCGEGIVCLDLISVGPADQIVAERVLENYPKGQLLVAGWGSIEPAIEVRKKAWEREMYVETLLGAVYPMGGGRVIAIMPLEDVKLPEPAERSIDQLIRLLPPHSIMLAENELPKGPAKGTTQTFARVMAMWERLHTPYLAAADMQVDPVQKIEAYRKTIRVDYACELAHQRLSGVAKGMTRR